MSKFIALELMTNSILIHTSETSITLIGFIKGAKITQIFYA
jgi:hypothetical protein